MFQRILSDIALMSAIGVVLAAIMVIAQRWLSNYGEVNLNINGKRDLTVKGGNSLLATLSDNQIFIPSACGGRGSCGACKCKVIEGGGPLLPTEKPLLSKAEQAGSIRLGCQVKVKSDIKIELPEAIFNIRRFHSVIEEIIDYTYDIKGITFKLQQGETIDFKAGQYVQLETEPYEKVKQKVMRAYSISSKPQINDRIQLIIRLVPEGICSTWVHKYLKVGDKVNFTGPYGDFYLRDTDADILFVAGGSGKAPIKSMLEHLREIGTNRKMTYFFGARTTKDLYLTDEFRAFEDVFEQFEYVPVLSHTLPEENWNGKTGFVMPYFKDAIRDPKNTEAYLCGSPGMINAVTKSLIEYGLSEDKIYYDSFG
ncbi:MAG: FAD-binding oxidoreductase [Candidatus Cloacimonadales bacterium]|jgi:Na+-transporting NADH:ubiquinone oxidoreductase subunit F|nr:2Fe-2S iron-sulfur cluster binding domain-containing protein [Candidatus Cloacimonadota bacterium]MDY0380586.1 FAD-binding oxidoreductase [Candidatus Cloacimonadaceae bacterium]HCM15423.1 oxidoreductase [Candidatus Cloacimonas sp.]MCB5256979.1 2Fe-2S iron-sulfur cluster binding domain-containing protein [Candidatus Cloacimonadota bacterium]MCB5263913.1 2Fe-2S iron-sulfur cluster binding domain-containing protein [Candidatus Cloacimonadota bacterium]